MSKKKALNTMTLKDFHGGSIPSDLPLPSAPGVVVKPTDRPQWGRSDNRSRPNSASSARNLDERTPFLANSAHIGRNFDEDERKPLDGVSVPRRTVSDESVRGVVPSRVNVNSYSGRVVGGGPESVGQGGLGRGSVNAWGTRKEGVSQPGWSVQSASSKLAHASALEKVSSGLWQTKPLVPIHYQADVEVISHNDERLGFVDEPEFVEASERKRSVYNEGVRSAHADGKYSASEVQGTVPLEAVERPKLKLLPRTKPLEKTEPLVVDQKQGCQQVGDRAGKSGNGFHGNMNSPKVGVAGAESGNHEVERPKLNLQRKSQSLEQSEEQAERERKALFGGARPRELVLKERGNDRVVNHEMDHPADRVKHDASKTGRIPGNAVSSRPSDKIENHPSDRRPGKNFERKDQHMDVERADAQKRNWRKENWRNNKEVEKPQPKERPTSPKTWRKPVEEPRPASEADGMRIGKAASALELAQAFSRSASDSKMGDQNSGQRSLPGQTQIPFSRLTGPTPRRQINGY